MRLLYLYIDLALLLLVTQLRASPLSSYVIGHTRASTREWERERAREMDEIDDVWSRCQRHQRWQCRLYCSSCRLLDTYVNYNRFYSVRYLVHFHMIVFFRVISFKFRSHSGHEIRHVVKMILFSSFVSSFIFFSLSIVLSLSLSLSSFYVHRTHAD